MTDRARLLDHVETQRLRLDSGRRGYDIEGDFRALDLAVTIRVLVYDNGRSDGKSLLTQLKVRDVMQFASTSDGVDPENLVSTTALTSIGWEDGQVGYFPHVIDPAAPRADELDWVR